MPASDPTDTLTTNTTTAPDPGNPAAVPAETAASAANDALAAAKKEAADNYERYLRAVADLENFRRRTVRDKDELRQFGVSRVLEDLLPVMDNLALGVAAAKQPNADLKTLIGGVEMVLNQFKSALGNHGLKEISPAGQAFDANFHESISAQPSAELAEGSVLKVVRTGYVLNGRLLRPASVVVSSGPAKEETKS
jgi:molecular chaperone GrpE